MFGSCIATVDLLYCQKHPMVPCVGSSSLSVQSQVACRALDKEQNENLRWKAMHLLVWPYVCIREDNTRTTDKKKRIPEAERAQGVTTAITLTVDITIVGPFSMPIRECISKTMER